MCYVFSGYLRRHFHREAYIMLSADAERSRASRQNSLTV